MFASSACSLLFFFQHLPPRVILLCFAMTLLPFFVVTLVSQGFGPKAEHGDLFHLFSPLLCNSFNVNSAMSKQKWLLFWLLFICWRFTLEECTHMCYTATPSCPESSYNGHSRWWWHCFVWQHAPTGAASHAHAICWCCTPSSASRVYESMSSSLYNYCHKFTMLCCVNFRNTASNVNKRYHLLWLVGNLSQQNDDVIAIIILLQTLLLLIVNCLQRMCIFCKTNCRASANVLKAQYCFLFFNLCRKWAKLIQRVIQKTKTVAVWVTTPLTGTTDSSVKASGDSIARCLNWLVKTSPLWTGLFFFSHPKGFYFLKQWLALYKVCIMHLQRIATSLTWITALFFSLTVHASKNE